MPADDRQRTKLQILAFAVADTVREEFGEGVSVIMLVDVPEPAPASMHELHFLGTVPPEESLHILRQAIAQCTGETGEAVPRAAVHDLTN